MLHKLKKRKGNGKALMKAREEWDKYGHPRKFSKGFAKDYTAVEKGTIMPFEYMRKLDLNVPAYYRYRQGTLIEQSAVKELLTNIK